MNRILRVACQSLVFVILILARAMAQMPRFAYVVDELSNSVSVYSIDANTGALTQVSLAAAGTEPTAITLDPTGRFAYVTNAISQDVSAYTVDPNTGALTPVPGSPFAAGADIESSVVSLPGGQFLYVATDESTPPSHLLTYSINATTGALTPVGSPVPAGTFGPIVVMHPTGRFLYKDSADNTNLAFAVDNATGALTPVPGSPFPTGGTSGAVVMDPLGRFLFSGNPLSNNVSAFAINGTTGALTPVPGSPFPAGNFPSVPGVDPTGKFLYVPNRSSNNISAFTIDASSGVLTPIPGSPFPAGNGPQFVAVDPTGHVAYVTNLFSNDISAYAISANTGALTPIANSPFTSGTQPVWLVFSQDYAAHVQPPINADGSSVFDAKRGVVPVKFTLTLHGTPTCVLPPATIALTRTAGAALGAIDESVFLLASDSGSNFRIDNTSCQYVYNLATGSLGPGAYLVQININGATVGNATFGLQ